MLQERLTKEWSELAEFAPDAEIRQICGHIAVDVPVRATDGSTEFRFRMIYDEDEAQAVKGIRIYPLVPTFQDIRQAISGAQLSPDTLDRLFPKDAAGNGMLQTDGALTGAQAVANANAHLSAIQRLLSTPDELRSFLNSGHNWRTLLPAFGVISFGRHIPKEYPPIPQSARFISHPCYEEPVPPGSSGQHVPDAFGESDILDRPDCFAPIPDEPLFN